MMRERERERESNVICYNYEPNKESEILVIAELKKA